MSSGKIVLLVFICGFGGIMIWSLSASYLRVIKSRSSWLSAMARIKSFGLNYGIPSIAYEYTVDGRDFKGNKFTPEARAYNPQESRTSYPKSFYLNSDGSLKFPPGGTVTVFYDPQNPSDAALVRGFPSNAGSAGLLTALSILALLIIGFFHLYWMKTHLGDIFPAIFFLSAVWLIYYGRRCMKRHFLSQNFPSVAGKLLNAEVVYSGSGNNSGGGYRAVVEFEYEVQGALYRSRQLKELSLWILKPNKQDVELMIDQLRAEPELNVFYDPKAPWDGFLQHVSLLGALIPLLMAIPFMGMGLFLGSHFWHFHF